MIGSCWIILNHVPPMSDATVLPTVSQPIGGWISYLPVTREMEYIEYTSYNIFTHFKTNTKSIAIYRVFRWYVLLENLNIVKVSWLDLLETNMHVLYIPSLCL